MMKLLVAIAVAALAAAGCAHTPPPTSGPKSVLLEFTQEDLATAIQIAQAAQPPDMMAINCATWAQSALAQPAAPFIPPTGAASTFEAGRIVLRTGEGQGAQINRDEAIIACGPLAISATSDIASAIATFQSGAFGQFLIDLVPLIGGAIP